MGVVFIVKQPPQLMKIYHVTPAEMFTDDVMFSSFIHVAFSRDFPPHSLTLTDFSGSAYLWKQLGQ